VGETSPFRQFKSEQNQDFTVHEGTITAIVTCHCRLGNEPMGICSRQVEIAYKFCGFGYRIVKVEYDFAKVAGSGLLYPIITVGRRPGAAEPMPSSAGTVGARPS
jgi:hypothetical protein